MHENKTKQRLFSSHTQVKRQGQGEKQGAMISIEAATTDAETQYRLNACISIQTSFCVKRTKFRV